MHSVSVPVSELSSQLDVFVNFWGDGQATVRLAILYGGRSLYL